MVPEHGPLDLTADGLGQRVDKLNLSGIFVRRRFALDKRLDLFLEFEGKSWVGDCFGKAVCWDDEGLHYLTADDVWGGHDGRLSHGRVLQKGGLDFERTDAVTGKGNL